MALRAALILLLAVAATAADAQSQRTFTENHAIKFVPGTVLDQKQLSAVPFLRDFVANPFGMAREDLNDDGVREVILMASSSAGCGSGGCRTVVLERRAGMTTLILDQSLMSIAVTNEKIGQYRALAAVDDKGVILTGDKRGTPMFGKQLVYPVNVTQSATPAQPAQGASAPAPSSVAGSAPAPSAVAGSMSADGRLQRQIAGPAGRWVGAAISPRGVHVAVLALRGSRSVVMIDGVEGPVFDALLNANGETVYAEPNGPRVWMSPAESGFISFSEDGAHSAYFGKVGAEYIAVLDGKEIARGPFSSSARISRLSFSPHGKHLYYLESNEPGVRVMMDGKPGPWSGESPNVAFSPDGAAYAYSGTLPATRETKFGVVNGRQVAYFGEDLQFNGAGNLVSKLTANRIDTLILDGKPMMRAANIQQVWVSKVGGHVAAVIVSKVGADTVFTVNGRPIPGTEGVRVDNVYFSADGKRYAAECVSPASAKFMLIDGKRFQEYQGLGDSPQFTADSSKFVYLGRSNGKSFLVVEDQEFEGTNTIMTPVLGGRARVAFGGANSSGNQFDLIVDDKMLSFPRIREIAAFAFSPDGARHAFMSYPAGPGAKTLVVDGVGMPGVVNEMPDNPNHYFVFSPDGSHVAYLGRDTRNPRVGGLWADGKLVAPTQGDTTRVTFSTDSKHLLWIVDTPGTRTKTWFVDGKPTVKFQMSDFDAVAGAREMGADGVLTFLTIEDGAIVRYRLTPSPDGSIAALIGTVK